MHLKWLVFKVIISLQKADILSILPNDMTGKEIKERYNTDLKFPETFNDFTVYKSTKK